MNFLQVTIARILVKVSPGKIQNTRNTDFVDLLHIYVNIYFSGGRVVLMTVHSMIKCLRKITLNR